MYTNSSRSYLKMASGTPRRTNGTPWRTGGTPTAEYSWKAREPLYLENELLSAARKQQQAAMETDDREGLVKKYLETKLPRKWDTMDLTERRLYLSGAEGLLEEPGAVMRDTVTHMEIYAECFGLDPARMRKQDSYDISSIMSKMEGWKKAASKKCTPYGRQRFYAKE